MRRREFLIGSAALAGMPAVWGQRPEPAKLDRIAIMSLCFSSVLKSEAHPDDPKRTLELMDFPDMVAEHYGVHWVEMMHTHFPSTETEYLQEFRNRVAKAKSRINQIDLEFGPLNISTPDPVLRVETVDINKRWIDHAVTLGCPRVMVNQGTLAPEVRPHAIDTLKKINAYAKQKNVFVTMENRGYGATSKGTLAPMAPGAPTPPSWDVVVEVIQAAGIHANPDVGNFPDEETRAKALRIMYPLSSGSSHCHYNPERYDEGKALQIAREVGYKGLFSIEAAANNGPDPYVAVQTILDELLKDI